MTTEQDEKELSMAEILASIKKILADNETGDKTMISDSDKRIPQISLPVREKTVSESVADNSSSSASGFTITDRNQENNLYTDADKLSLKAEINEVKSVNVSDDIINSFTRMFEQNDFRRQAEQPHFDADALLRQIVNQSVAQKLDNKFLQNIVQETIIPVLEEWLSHYLPRLVAEEVERVLVKTGRR